MLVCAMISECIFYNPETIKFYCQVHYFMKNFKSLLYFMNLLILVVMTKDLLHQQSLWQQSLVFSNT